MISALVVKDIAEDVFGKDVKVDVSEDETGDVAIGFIFSGGMRYKLRILADLFKDSGPYLSGYLQTRFKMLKHSMAVGDGSVHKTQD